ncbi:MAG: hypothetical protein WC373_16850 [Smithella sp.]|jgi:hypothetical protein
MKHKYLDSIDSTIKPVSDSEITEVDRPRRWIWGYADPRGKLHKQGILKEVNDEREKGGKDE